MTRKTHFSAKRFDWFVVLLMCKYIHVYIYVYVYMCVCICIYIYSINMSKSVWSGGEKRELFHRNRKITSVDSCRGQRSQKYPEHKLPPSGFLSSDFTAGFMLMSSCDPIGRCPRGGASLQFDVGGRGGSDHIWVRQLWGLFCDAVAEEGQEVSVGEQRGSRETLNMKHQVCVYAFIMSHVFIESGCLSVKLINALTITMSVCRRHVIIRVSIRAQSNTEEPWMCDIIS